MYVRTPDSIRAERRQIDSRVIQKIDQAILLSSPRRLSISSKQMPQGREDGEKDSSPFARLSLNRVHQDAVNAFSASPLDVGKCAQLITQLLYLLNQGEEQLSEHDATKLFFATSQLFRSNDPHLRRLTFILVRELRVSPDNALIMVSCLNKDITSSNEMLRANALRVLPRVLDVRPSYSTWTEVSSCWYPGVVGPADRAIRQAGHRRS